MGSGITTKKTDKTGKYTTNYCSASNLYCDNKQCRQNEAPREVSQLYNHFTELVHQSTLISYLDIPRVTPRFITFKRFC